MMGILHMLVFCWIFDISRQAESFYDDNKAYKVYEEWNKNDPEHDKESDEKDDESSRSNYEKRKNKGIEAKMVVIDMPDDTDYKTTESTSKVWETRLKNMYIPVNRFIVNKQVVILSMKETSKLNKLIMFFLKEKGCKSFKVDSQTYTCGLAADHLDL